MDGSPLKPVIAIVVPCYNEEEVLTETAKKMSGKIQELVSEQKISEKSFLVFVDDGSKDKTWIIIEKLHGENSGVFRGIKLSKNRGHQNALLCGLLFVKNMVDAAISIDADLQDDIEVIDQMLECFGSGTEIVCGIRLDRKNDGFFKRTSARFFYRVMDFLGAGLIHDHADFRLMGRSALEALAEYSETNIFLRGIIPLLGFRTGNVNYKRKERSAGTSKYNFKKMLNLAIGAITSFSTRPLRLIGILGVLLFTGSLIYAVYLGIKHLSGLNQSVLSAILCSIWGLGGLIILSIGIVGEYIGKIYSETKGRPRYHIEKLLFHM